MNTRALVTIAASLATLTIAAATSARADGPVITAPITNIPITPLAVQQTTLRAEFNLAGEASMQAEASFVRPSEGLAPAAIDRNPGESLVVDSGQEVAILFARYSQPYQLMGFYWALGAGWRDVHSVWKRPITDNTSQYSLASTVDIDGKNRFVSEQVSQGNTLHARLGYRTTMPYIPIILGGQLGVRHFNSVVHDAGDDSTVPLNDDDKTSLRHRMMTYGSLELSAGYAF